jgi:hypothetical protein
VQETAAAFSMGFLDLEGDPQVGSELSSAFSFFLLTRD